MASRPSIRLVLCLAAAGIVSAGCAETAESRNTQDEEDVVFRKKTVCIDYDHSPKGAAIVSDSVWFVLPKICLQVPGYDGHCTHDPLGSNPYFENRRSDSVSEREALPADMPSADTMFSVVKRGLLALKRCADQQRERDPATMKNGARLYYRVNQDGQCSDVLVTPEVLADSIFEDCVKLEINRWRYPSFSGDPISVKLPLGFSGE